MATRFSLRRFLLVPVAAWVACAAPPPAPPSPYPGPSEEEVRAFFRNPSLDRPVLSPDGQRLLGVVTLEGLPLLTVKHLDTGETDYLNKIDLPGMSLHTLGWSGDDVIVVGFDWPSQRGADRSRHSRMRAIRRVRDRWREDESWTYPLFPGFRAAVIDWLHHDPERILLNSSTSQRREAGAVEVRVRSGTRESVVPPQLGVDLYHADPEGRPRAASGRSREGAGRVGYARRAGGDPERPFEPLAGSSLASGEATRFAGYGPDPSRLYVTAAGEGGRRALYDYDLESWALGEKVYEHSEVDVGEAVFSLETGLLAGIEVEPGRPELVFFDAAAEQRQAAIDRALPDTLNRIVGHDAAGRRALLRASSDIRPPELYLFDTASKTLEPLYAELPDLDPDRLSPMEVVSYRARDGREIPAYLTRPRAVEGKGPGPAVLVVHDGPSQRAHWGWDPTAQLLASRGFAVLQPNYRGSRGYGSEHELAGDAEWGQAMQEDLADGAGWLVEQGIAAPARVGIYGRGYGGYAALFAAAAQPDIFRAAASHGGLSDLVAIEEDPELFASDETNLPMRGNLPEHRLLLAERSPALRADRVRAPVFVSHGGEDPVVHPSQSRRMIRALEEVGAVFESQIDRDERDRFVGEAARIDFHRRLLRFFEEHLAELEPL